MSREGILPVGCMSDLHGPRCVSELESAHCRGIGAVVWRIDLCGRAAAFVKLPAVELDPTRESVRMIAI